MGSNDATSSDNFKALRRLIIFWLQFLQSHRKPITLLLTFSFFENFVSIFESLLMGEIEKRLNLSLGEEEEVGEEENLFSSICVEDGE